MSPDRANPAHLAEDPRAALALGGPAISRFWRGAKLGFPIFLGYIPVGMAFGVLARTLGFAPAAAVVCSATALAGAGQFIALSTMGTGASAVAVLIATTVVNARYILFGSTLSPYLHGVPIRTQAAIAFSLTDETFAVNIADRRSGLSTPASMIGVGAIAWTGWVVGTAAGAAGAGLIGDPGRFGVAFAMPAMFTALFVALAENRRHVAIGVTAGVIAIGLPALAQAGIAVGPAWYVVISSTMAATIGAVVWRDD